MPLAATPRPGCSVPFDPLLHGWASRRPFVGDHGSVVTVNGIFRPVALVGGRVVATWGLPGGRVTVTPLEPLAARARRALAGEGADVLRFLACATSRSSSTEGPSAEVPSAEAADRMLA